MSFDTLKVAELKVIAEELNNTSFCVNNLKKVLK